MGANFIFQKAEKWRGNHVAGIQFAQYIYSESTIISDIYGTSSCELVIVDLGFMARYRILSDDSTSFEISLRDESFVVMELPDSLISFDRSGRFLGAFLDGINFRRGMDNRFQKRWRLSRENQQQENLSNSEAENLMERIQNILWKLIRAEDIKNQPNLLKMAEKCTRNDWEILRDDGLKFLEICGGVPI